MWAASAASYHFAFGFVSKAAATTATYPYQVVKARMQQRASPASSSQAPPEEYSRFTRAVATTWRREGAGGFYKGFAANLLRVAPQSAITLVAYEEIKRLLEAL